MKIPDDCRFSSVFIRIIPESQLIEQAHMVIMKIQDTVPLAVKGTGKSTVIILASRAIFKHFQG